MAETKSCLITIDVEEDLDTHHASEKSYRGIDILESTLQEILDMWSVKATFFVTGDVIEERTETIKALCQKNEIGAHGLHHIPIVSLPSSSRRESLVKLCHYADRTLNRALKGFRAVRNMIDNETLSILSALGFLYDSSVVPRYLPLKRYGGYKGSAPTYPYHPSDNDYRSPGPAGIWELPITCARIMNIPLYGTWIRYMGPKITRLLLPNTNYINIAMHSWDFIKTKKSGFRTGKKFPKILREIVGFLYEKGFIFQTCSSLCKSMTREGVH